MPNSLFQIDYWYRGSYMPPPGFILGQAWFYQIGGTDSVDQYCMLGGQSPWGCNSQKDSNNPPDW